MINDWNNNTATYGAQTTTGDYIDLWSAFGGELDITKRSTDTTYFINCGLSNSYWSSAQNNSCNIYCADFHFGYIDNIYVNNDALVRLSATF